MKMCIQVLLFNIILIENQKDVNFRKMLVK